jgi:NAD(P)-dependent dehydrogenase (short-subunit alcohol dehydrogenase family)
MTDKKVWFITGAGRGMGVDIAQAALAAGHAVVATGRNTKAVADAVGEADDLLVVQLDITSLASAEAALQAAVDRFGRIDVLVNNAGNFYAGYFEELTPEQIERSLTTNLVGPMNVTRAVLPVMRKQRSGNVVTITSTAGIVGQEFCSAYAASKFGVEGWMESLRFEVEPLGIHTTIVEPGFFRTELLEKESTAYAELSIDDYAERTAQTRPAWEAMSGKQGGDPAKLAKALVTIVDQEQPPLRWVAGADAVETVEQKANDLLAQVDAHRDLSTSLALDEHKPDGNREDGSHEGRRGS